MQRTWTDVGAEIIGERIDDGETLTVELIERAIDALEWREAKGVTTVAAMPGMAINELVREFNIPKVSAFAISNELAPYGLYGIEGNYKNGRARVYVIDLGAVLKPVASDFWEKVDA